MFVPPPKKPGSVKDMAKMFGSNVGLENVSSNSNRIEGACHGIPNSGNTCYIGKIRSLKSKPNPCVMDHDQFHCDLFESNISFSGNPSMSEQFNSFKNFLH